MDPGALSLSVRAVIVCLLGAARCYSSAVKNNCSCSEIPRLPLTKPPPETCSDRFRYVCEAGYLRKAGTSNLIHCDQSNTSAPKWTKASLLCIPDPGITKTQPPPSPVTTASFTDRQMTPRGSFSPLVVLETKSVEPSLATDWRTTAPSNQAPNNRTDNPDVSGHTDHRLVTTVTAPIVCASLAIVCGFICYGLYRRRSKNNDPLAADEEMVSMNTVPAGPAL